MIRRACAFMVALMIFAAPIAATICQATCSLHDDSAHSAHQHSCAAPGDVAPLGVKAVPHGCGHPASDDGPIGIEQSLNGLAAPAVLVVHVLLAPPPQSVGTPSTRGVIDPSPPGLLARIAQLRV